MHDHSGHSLAPDLESGAAQQRLLWIMGLTGAFMLVEVAGGLLSGSLALLADAGHMLTDLLAVGLASFALWLAGRQTSPTRTYGFKRAELLAAFVNALALLVLAAWIVVEAVERLQAPRPIQDQVLLWVAVAGVAVNIAGVALLYRHAHSSLNLRAALWHIVGDLLGSLGAVTAALVIRYTGWTAIDALVGIAVALLICLGAGRILLDSTNMLLDSVPKEIDSQAVQEFLATYGGVRQICDLHIWGISSQESMLSAHLVVEPALDRDAFLHALLGDLQSRFPLAHMTVQLESTPHPTCPPGW